MLLQAAMKIANVVGFVEVLKSGLGSFDAVLGEGDLFWVIFEFDGGQFEQVSFLVIGYEVGFGYF